MSTQFISELVDIYQRPLARPNADHTVEVTFGDVHANVIKLIFSLIREGIATLSIESFSQCVTIYLDTEQWCLSSPPDKQTKQRMTQDIHEFQVQLSELTIIRRDIVVRILGDELADRGCNDWFVLLLLQKLVQERVPIKCLLSNHSADFIEAVECYDVRATSGCVLHVRDAHHPQHHATGYVWDSVSEELTYVRKDQVIELVTLIHPKRFTQGLVKRIREQNNESLCFHLSQEDLDALIVNNSNHAPDAFYGSTISGVGGFVKSLMNLSWLIRYQLIPFENIRTIFNTCYKPMLCLLDETVDNTTRETYIFSHAPIGIHIIQELASRIGIATQGLSLAAIIPLINRYFLDHYIVGSEKISSLYCGTNALQALIHAILWNRNGDNETLWRLAQYKGEHLQWVHGHDLNSGSHDHVTNLDNLLGKNTSLNKGEYKVLLKT